MTSGIDGRLAHDAPRERARLVATAYDQCAGELLGYLCRSCGSRDAAEDLLQETFLHLVRELGAGRQPTELRPWLYRVATNLARSRGRHLAVVDRVRARWRGPEAEPSPEEGYLRHESRTSLQSALDHLAPDARSAVLLSAEGFSGAEVAALIGRSPLAVRSLLCRARHDLRSQLAGEEARA